MATTKTEILKTVDLDTTETEELAKLVEEARDEHAYLHIEVRKVTVILNG